jgi:hypothetical membrane protein
MKKTANWRGRLFLLAMVGCVQFLLLSTVAMFFYPGGTYSDGETIGYTFTQNFFSDLGRTAAHNGDSNTVSMVLFIIALSMAGLSLIVFFLAVPPHFAENRTSRRLSTIGSVLGVISGLGFIGIAAMPADVNQTVHRLFVYIAFTGFLFVVFLYSAAILKSRTYPRAYAYAYFAFAIILALYLALLFSGPELETTGGLTIQAVGQKVVVYAGIICVVIQSYGAYQVERRRLTQAASGPGRE